MIGYVTIGTNDLARTGKFYDGLLAELGGKDEGPPGIPWGNFYVAYIRDPEGNKLNAFCMQG
jgi:catechol 2,3-dioxygenase-like lactoylglutathione lyase family enzyme